MSEGEMKITLLINNFTSFMILSYPKVSVCPFFELYIRANLFKNKLIN
jgi:hypothetical protein